VSSAHDAIALACPPLGSKTNVEEEDGGQLAVQVMVVSIKHCVNRLVIYIFTAICKNDGSKAKIERRYIYDGKI